MEQDVSGRQAEGHAVNQQGAGVGDQGDTLGLVLAEVWQSEGRLRVDEMMMDVPLGGHKHEATANTFGAIHNAFDTS